MDAVGVSLDAGVLGDAAEGAVLVEGADAPGHAAVLRDGVPEQVAHHAVVVDLAVGVGGKIVVDDLEGLRAVVIVRIDDGEGAVKIGLCRQHGVAGAPWLDAALGDGVALGQLIQLLERILHVHRLGDPLADGGFEGVLDFVLDNKDDRLKACAAGVVQGIVHDDLTAGPHRVDLLHPAVAAAHAGRHDHQNRFVHMFSPPPKGVLQNTALLYSKSRRATR